MRVIEEIMKEEGRKVSESFPDLFTCEGKISTQFMQNMNPSQQRGRRVPIQLQELVTEEIKTMITMGKITKVNTIKEDVFIHPTVITMEKRQKCKNRN